MNNLIRFTLGLILIKALVGCSLVTPYTDASGLSHEDKPLKITNKVVVLRLLPKDKLEELYKKVNSKRTLESDSRVYSFAIFNEGSCSMFLPMPLGPRDESWKALLWHELRHCYEGNYHK